jgi:hypothetical protein
MFPFSQIGAAYRSFVRTTDLKSIVNELALRPHFRVQFLVILYHANQHCDSFVEAWRSKLRSLSMVSPSTVDFST